jgi:hypothetical protein
MDIFAPNGPMGATTIRQPFEAAEIIRLRRARFILPSGRERQTVDFV